jgi:RNA methyltransferase, TrmH family
MLVEKITSRQNPLVKRFRAIRAGNEHQHILLEGLRLIEDGLAAGAHFETVAFTSAIEESERGLRLMDELQKVPCRGAHMTPQVMQAIADTQSPQGIAAIVSRPFYELGELFAAKPTLLIIADGLQDPGNLGTIVRTAEGAGASGLITTRETVDPFNQKALRASMGSALRLPIVTDASYTDVAQLCREQGIALIGTRQSPARKSVQIEDATLAEKTHAYTDANLTAPLAFILGREASGITEETAAEADQFIYIPMSAQIESLNVSAAAAVLLYEAARQRRFANLK